MKVDRKRKVIETLMCATNPGRMVSVVGYNFGGARLMSEAVLAHAKVSAPWMTYEDEALEAAYRLIESSPSLRREWFGK
jgi:hypothetical protein